MVKFSDIRVGSIVMVRPAFGSQPAIRATVEHLDSDIKNGRPGIEYGESWAYLSQVDSVVKY